MVWYGSVSARRYELNLMLFSLTGVPLEVLNLSRDTVLG